MHIDLEFTFYSQHNKNIRFPDNCLLVVLNLRFKRDTCNTKGELMDTSGGSTSFICCQSWLFRDTALASVTQNSSGAEMNTLHHLHQSKCSLTEGLSVGSSCAC